MSSVGQAPSEGARNQRPGEIRRACCVPVGPWSSLHSSILASFLGFSPSRRVRSVRSLQLKFSALVATLLVAASVGLAWMATRHERAALEAEVRKRGSAALATNLAGVAKILLLEGEHLGGASDGRTAQAVVPHLEEGLVAARLIKFETSDSGEITETIVASLNPENRARRDASPLEAQRSRAAP